MKVIILNAGKGGRLGALTEERPKCLVDVGGRPILDYQLDALRLAGVTELVMVVGYREEAVRAHLARYPEFSVTFIGNPDYANTNTAYSLWLARHEMTSDFLYFNGDVLFHPQLVERLVTAPAENALAVEHKRCGDEEVKVILDGSRITAIGKEVDQNSSFGEFIGIARFSGRVGPLFRKTLEEVIERRKLLKNYFETAVDLMLDQAPFTSVDITDLPCIEIDFPEDLERARTVVLPRFTEAPSEKKKILFYIQRDLQLPFLEPIHDHLKRRYPALELAFAAPSFILPRDGNPGWGLQSEEVARLSRKSHFVRTVEEFAPDVTVFADACTNVMNCGKRVFVGHGIISKGGFYTDNPLVRRENLADLICVPGEWHKDILSRNVFSPIAVTGFIKSDRLFGPSACTREAFCHNHAIPPEKRIVLYAPTFNAELSAIPTLGERVVELCDPDTYMVIKLHTMTDIRWVELHRRLVGRHPHVRFLEGIDVTPAMAAADILVSDVSSVVVEFMALDRPVIAVNNPRQHEYDGYIPTDVEYRVRDACLQVGTVEELTAAVQRSFAFPNELSEKRRQYAEALCYGRDGHSAQRAAEAVIQLVQGSWREFKPSTRFSIVLLPETATAPGAARVAMAEARKRNAGIDLEFIVISDEPARWGDGIKWLAFENATMDRLLTAATGDYLVFLSPLTILPERWLEFLFNYFRWHADTGMVRTLSVKDEYKELFRQIFPGIGTAAEQDVAALLLSTLMGRDVPMTTVVPDCLMVSRAAWEQCAPLPGCPVTGDGMNELARQLSVAGFSQRMALDLFSYPRHAVEPCPATLERLTDAYERDPDNREAVVGLLSYLSAHGFVVEARALCVRHQARYGDDCDFKRLATSVV